MIQNWTEWKNIQDQASKNPAVYKIRLIDANKKPIKIGRLVKPDSDGVLSIGETGNMERRRNQFIKGFESGGEPITGERGGHVAGNKIFVLNKKGIMNIKLESLEYSYYETKDHKQCEVEFIGDYIKNYGEEPPLNSNFPNRQSWAIATRNHKLKR